MPFLTIIELVGFATGAALHLYIAWLIWHRRLGSGVRLTQVERTLVVLGLCLGVWFCGNLFITLHELLLGRERFTGGLRAWGAVTAIGVAILPAALLHAHVAFYAQITNYRTLSRRRVRWVGVALYTPMAFLPYALYMVSSGVYESFLVKLRTLLLPYSIWYLLALCSSSLIDWAIVKKLDRKAVRERKFFNRLAVLLIVIGVFEFVAVGLRLPEPDDPLWIAYVLLSLMPTFFVAYHVYRYKIVNVAIQGSLVYATFAILFIAVYIYGIRRLDEYLVAHYAITPGVVEVILILAMFALAGPIVRIMDQTVHRLFAREFGLYRDVVRQVSSGAAGFGEFRSLSHYLEETIRQGLELVSVRIVALVDASPESPERRIAESMADRQADVVEQDEDLRELNATAAYALRREGQLTGLLLIGADPHTLTSEKRAVLDVLASQVAIEIEAVRLVEEKVSLERKLAHRERLATLGQMAATVAHEVKNPLSSIKAIAQVMREEPALKDYDRDLSLIVGEIDRLNRSVSQLLAFSRPALADARPVAVEDMLRSIVDLAVNEARELGVELRVTADSKVILTGTQGAALREAVSNLVLNAIQASATGDTVSITAHITGPQPDRSTLILSVTDTGPGISADAQQRVFEPFYTTKSRGTGLGLAIVQRRVSEIGGRVELISPVANHRGTQFKLLIPLAADPQ